MSDRDRILAAALLGVAALAARADADESKIEAEDLPKAVLKVVKAKFPEAKIRGAAKEVEGGETKYEVEMTVDGKNVDVVFEPDGEIEAIEKEIEAEDLPKAVLKAAKSKFPKAKIGKVEEITLEGDKVLYEIAFASEGGKSVEVVMAPNGKIVEKDEAEEEKGGKKEGKKLEKDDEDDEGDKDDKKSKKKKDED
jgi:hypothetical protein